MPLHPQAARFVEMVAGAPPVEAVPVEASRQSALDTIPLTGEVTELAAVEDQKVKTENGLVPVRIYRPSLAGGLPVTAFFHGGGWIIGDLDTHDRVARDLAAFSGAVVVAVDYRRAPEDPFPAAYDDCLGVIRRLLEDGAGLDVDRTRVAVAGDSAGGNLAAVACQQLRGVGSGIVHQVLVFPVTDATAVGETASYREFGEGHFITTRDMAHFVRCYSGDTDPADVRISPLRAADLSGLPPATVLTAECDPLRDEGEAYASRLEQAGVEVTTRRFDGQVHPFILLGGIIDDANVARSWLGERLRAAFTA
ncbi:alpha/beta hydrolase [Actinoallomurus bryophytorum]|uniref:Acetyl esterase n=1 Tax=Actinoallomurus bryophytorum TaxID=1490222 RepID=A0A543C0X8_9ACTN|nr:alpha/beta hydrolase [Actinoallomurus bryophytorum]TQL90734.1 acetyl esterase [Actinoallomurus bryophytorum]